MLRRFLKIDNGFSLIELMVIIAIIGILIAIAIPVFDVARESAYAKTCQANLRTLDGAVQTFKESDPSERWPVNLNALVSENFIKSNPRCPKAESNYAYGATSSSASVGGSLADTSQQTSPVVVCPGYQNNIGGYSNHTY